MCCGDHLVKQCGEMKVNDETTMMMMYLWCATILCRGVRGVVMKM